ncbi:TPM domain-containing protein [Undibacterium sp.]|uniref:TPM domain-containing protein n=1 Tax=Undibacterium sp. TaxID=1914977 RepID=UPI0025CD5B6D|nr:TPM domain-containing protein [Undibacterium sp.]
MNIKRIARHLFTSHSHVNRVFPHHTLMAIERAIKASETAHVGEIRFVVEGALDSSPLFKGQSARERALDVFSQLRIWDTEHNNGVLIYLLLADRDVEIIADRGIHAKAGSHEWDSICRQMETAFKQANFEGGVVGGIQAVTQHLTKHFPAAADDRNELPDKPVVL